MQSPLRQARIEGYAISVVEMEHRLYRMALVPVLAPDLIGWAGIGTGAGRAYFPMDTAWARHAPLARRVPTPLAPVCE